MDELIVRLEKATGPDRDLDWKIWFNVAEQSEDHGTDGWLRYTSSIDAALTLVPEDPANPGKPMLWSIAYDEDGCAGERSYTAGLGKGYHDPEYIYGHSKSPAIALCIAALKARTAMRGMDVERKQDAD